MWRCRGALRGVPARQPRADLAHERLRRRWWGRRGAVVATGPCKGSGEAGQQPGHQCVSTHQPTPRHSPSESRQLTAIAHCFPVLPVAAGAVVITGRPTTSPSILRLESRVSLAGGPSRSHFVPHSPRPGGGYSPRAGRPYTAPQPPGVSGRAASPKALVSVSPFVADRPPAFLAYRDGTMRADGSPVPVPQPQQPQRDQIVADPPQGVLHLSTIASNLSALWRSCC